MDEPSGILKKIIEHKRKEVSEAQNYRGLVELKAWADEQDAARGFVRQLRARSAGGHIAVIAEIKRASPSKGVLRESFDPLAIAKAYMSAGATCLSVLTDQKFFMGSGVVLDLVRKQCPLPALRKDFIIEPYQIYESRAFGADCILLIVAAVHGQVLQDLFGLAREQGLDVLVEVHNEDELAEALTLGESLDLIGINNRDLHTFETDLNVTVELVRQIPTDSDLVIVSESGIATPADIARLNDAGVHSCLVGEALMRSPDPGFALRELLS